jgi:hypothetical protein
MTKLGLYEEIVDGILARDFCSQQTYGPRREIG